MGLVNNFIIAVYGAMNYSLPMPNLIGFYAKLNVVKKKKNFILHRKFPAEYFPLRVDLVEKGGNNENGRVASLECVSIHQNIILFFANFLIK